MLPTQMIFKLTYALAMMYDKRKESSLYSIVLSIINAHGTIT